MQKLKKLSLSKLTNFTPDRYQNRKFKVKVRHSHIASCLIHSIDSCQLFMSDVQDFLLNGTLKFIRFSQTGTIIAAISQNRLQCHHFQFIGPLSPTKLPENEQPCQHRSRFVNFISLVPLSFHHLLEPIVLQKPCKPLQASLHKDFVQVFFKKICV